MDIIYVIIGAGIIILIFMFLWLRERRRADAEYIAYGLRSNDDSDENTKTNVTAMEAAFIEAMEKLEALGEVNQDQWGKWVWTKTGETVGQNTQVE